MKMFAVPILLVAFSAGSFAEAEVRDVSVSGSIDLDLVWRNNYTDFDNRKKDQPAYAELEVNLPIIARFTDKVSSRIELEESQDFSNGADATNIGFDIDEAYVYCKEFLWERLALKLGKQEILYSARGAAGKNQSAATPAG